MIFVALLLLLGVSAVIYTTASSTSVAITNRQADVTALALVQARDALVGRAASHANRPGSLPCPDFDDGSVNPLNTANDGVTDLYAGPECPSYIGRLPWRTLGLPDLRDGNGERLWYAVTREFARNPTCGSTCPLNSDTKGALTITGTSAASDVIAVVFSPGSIVGSQMRGAANENTIANYLEGGNETGIGTSTFVTGTTTDTFNDRLLAISGADVMTPVERRAAREILTLLQTYRSASSDGAGPLRECYPWADFSDGASATGDNYGRVPLLGALPHTWASLAITVPTWLTTNRWWWVFFYTIAPSETESHGAGTLTVDGVPGTSVVLITTGPAGATRPAGSPGTWDNDWWSFYVDDSNNSDMGSNFSTPSSTAYARDRLYTL